MTINNAYLKTATEAAKESGKLFKKYFGHPKHVSKKQGNFRNLVTEVDLQIEKNIKKIINKNFPDHGFLGEETGWEDITNHDFNWIIDPIDGTTNYIQGIPMCCISIALWDKKGPLVGVIYNPITNQLFSAARGKGTYLNNKRIFVSKTSTAAAGLGGLGWSLQIPKAIKMYSTILPDIRKARVLGTTALQLAYVAAGIYDFYLVHEMHIWDIAAGILLIQEAGGKVSNWQGENPGLNDGNLVATNGKIHSEFLKLTKKL